MEPIGTAASVMTLFTVLSAGSKAIAQLKDAPNKLDQLEAELNNLRIHADRMCQLAQTNNVDESSSNGIQAVVIKLQRAQQTFNEKLSIPQHERERKSRFQRRIWIKRKGTIQKLTKLVREIRNDLNNAFHLLILSSMISHRSMIDRQNSMFRGQSYQTMIQTSSQQPDPSSRPTYGRKNVEEYFETDQDVFDDEMSAFDEYLDAVSHFSESVADAINSTVSLVRVPAWTFERSSSFFPEIYVLEKPFDHRSMIFTMVQVCDTGSFRVDRYFLLFASDARHWKQVICYVCIPKYLNIPKLMTSPHGVSVYQTLPMPVQSRLESDLITTELSARSVNVVRIDLGNGENDNLESSFEFDRLFNDIEKPEITPTFEYVERLKHEGVPIYREQDIVVHRRENDLFLVFVECKLCIEWKVPFAERAKSSTQPLEDYLEDLDALRRATGYTGIAQFVGVVLNYDYTRLCSFLVEAPRQGSLARLMRRASMNGRPISWTRREKWLRQLLLITQTIHNSLQMVLGHRPWSANEVWVDSSDDIVIVNFKLRATWMANQEGWMPPELRKRATEGVCFPRIKLNFLTDMFQLGMYAWRLAEHKLSRIFWCPSFGCTKRPIYHCPEDHRNPIALPLITSKEIPDYINQIVTACRQEQPCMRTAVHKLLEMMPTVYKSDSGAIEMTDILHIRNEPPIWPRCDACSGLVREKWYHCGICMASDMDICADCYAAGMKCLDSSHKLTCRMFKDRTIVGEVLES